MTIIWQHKLDDHVDAALKISGSKQRFSGVVIAVDKAGTTAWVQSGEQVFLAFTHRKPIRGNTTLTLKVGDFVSFRVDGQRAKDILVEQEAQIGEEACKTLKN